MLYSPKPASHRPSNPYAKSTPTTTWQRYERKERRRQKRVLRFLGVKPAQRRWVTCVEVTAIEVPQWAKDKAVPNLYSGPEKVWFKGRSSVHARMLAFQDREAGGEPEVTKVECRSCSRCKRLMLGLEANARRGIDEDRKGNGRDMPCGPECEVTPRRRTHGNATGSTPLPR
jgi:hypothetical protein